MQQVRYGDYQITPAVQPLGRNRWNLLPRITGANVSALVSPTMFSTADPENQIVTSSEHEAIKQCIELGKMIIDADLQSYP